METWVDLLQSKSALKKSKRKTRAIKALKHSPVKQEVLLDYSPVNDEPLHDSTAGPDEIELLRMKVSHQQNVIAEVTRDREHLLKQLELLRHQRNGDNTMR